MRVFGHRKGEGTEQNTAPEVFPRQYKQHVDTLSSIVNAVPFIYEWGFNDSTHAGPVETCKLRRYTSMEVSSPFSFRHPFYTTFQIIF